MIYRPDYIIEAGNEPFGIYANFDSIPTIVLFILSQTFDPH